MSILAAAVRADRPCGYLLSTRLTPFSVDQPLTEKVWAIRPGRPFVSVYHAAHTDPSCESGSFQQSACD